MMNGSGIGDISPRAVIFAIGKDNTVATLEIKTGKFFFERKYNHPQKVYQTWIEVYKKNLKEKKKSKILFLTVSKKPHNKGIFNLFYTFASLRGDVNKEHPFPFHDLTTAEHFTGLYKHNFTKRQNKAGRIAERFRNCLICARLVHNPSNIPELKPSYDNFPRNYTKLNLDCEALGFYGEIISVAYTIDHNEQGVFWCEHKDIPCSEKARNWVEANVKIPHFAQKMDSPRALKDKIWEIYKNIKGPVVIIAKNWYPVEHRCFKDRKIGKVFEASTVQLITQIRNGECPRERGAIHDPLKDAKHASRIVELGLQKRGLTFQPIPPCVLYTANGPFLVYK